MARRVLVVCRANVCRSPYITSLLRRRVPELDFASAGVAVTTGSVRDPRMLALLRSRGEPVPIGLPRRVTPAHAKRAALIITAAHEHRVAVAALCPAAADRTFTLLELARIAAEVPRSAGVPGLIAAAQTLLGDQHPVESDDLRDPYRGSDEQYREMERQVDEALAALVPVLRGR